MIRKCLIAGALLTVATPAFADEDAEWLESPQYFLATGTPSGERIYHEDEVVFSAPLRWFLAAQLGQARELQIGDEAVSMEEGQILPMVMYMPDGTRDSAELAFCTPRKKGENAARSGIGGFLLGGGALWESLARDLTDTQFCLRDTDDDELLESTFLVGEGEGNSVVGEPVEPVAIEMRTDAEISPEDEVRIRLVHVGRRRLEFRLDIIQQGHQLDFTTISRGEYSARLSTRVDVSESDPVSVTIFGVEFQVTAHDRRENTATISWPDNELPRRVILPDTYRRTLTFSPY